MNKLNRSHADKNSRFGLRPKQTAASLPETSRQLQAALFDSECPIFLDTNILIWSFGLNESASAAWQKWLFWLGDRLTVPAWVVHEYNQLSGNPEISNPYKGLPRKLKVVFDELIGSAARALDSGSATSLNCSSKVDLERRLTASTDFVLRVGEAVSKSDRGHRMELLKFYETLLAERSRSADIHALGRAAHAEFDARSALRLSPGGEDAGKPENHCGDLIIWNELLAHCVEAGQSKALLVSNDVKPDWCYTPQRLVLEGGKEIPWSDSAARGLRLPNPDLIAEFRAHTGGEGLVLASIVQIIEALASTTNNTAGSADFSVLAQAIRADRTPTDQAVDWFLENPGPYSEAMHRVAAWEISPDEVDQENFEEWCRRQMGDAGFRLDQVNWTTVFCALFI